MKFWKSDTKDDAQGAEGRIDDLEVRLSHSTTTHESAVPAKNGGTKEAHTGANCTSEIGGQRSRYRTVKMEKTHNEYQDCRKVGHKNDREVHDS